MLAVKIGLKIKSKKYCSASWAKSSEEPKYAPTICGISAAIFIVVLFLHHFDCLPFRSWESVKSCIWCIQSNELNFMSLKSGIWFWLAAKSRCMFLCLSLSLSLRSNVQTNSNQLHMRAAGKRVVMRANDQRFTLEWRIWAAQMPIHSMVFSPLYHSLHIKVNV